LKQFVSIFSILLATSLVSANAIAISDRNLAKLKLEITSGAEVQSQIANPADGLWVVGDSVIVAWCQGGRQPPFPKALRQCG
jgi:hypothetical protein